VLAQEAEKVDGVLGRVGIKKETSILSGFEVSQVPFASQPYQPADHHLTIDDVPGILGDGVFSRLSPGHGA